MSKHLSFILLTLIMLGIPCQGYSQQYNEADKEGLRKFLRQERNYENLGLTPADTLNWYTSEKWISETKDTWSWKNGRLIRLVIVGDLGDLPWKGNLDCSAFTYLEELSCLYTSIASINISKNINLINLDCLFNSLKTPLDFSKNINLKVLNYSGNNRTSLDVSKNINLEELTFQYSGLTSLDVSKNVNLKILDCSYNQLSSLDVSKNTNLENLNCSWNQLSSLDISKNTNLENLNCSWNQLSSLDVSKHSKLKMLYYNNNKLTKAVDTSKNSNLAGLICDENQLKTLDISNNLKLEFLACSLNELTSLDISKNTKLKNIYCSSNYFKFSTLPKIIFKYLRQYSPQKTIPGGEIAYNQLIDLSSEYSIEGNNTSYQWYNANNQKINLTDKGNGKFIAGDTYVGQKLTCKMTNAYFPGLTLEYEVTITQGTAETPKVISNFLVKTSEADLHQVKTGDIFKVNVAVSSEIEKVQIGLFSTDGISLLENTTQSRNNNTFTCKVPNTITNGNYILQPYITNNSGKVIILEREKGEFLVDKLPISVTGNDIWNKSVPISDLTLSSHLQLKTAQGNKYAVEQDVNFMVYAPQPSATTRIGLFTINGVLMEDVTLSRKNNTFTCKISTNVPAAAYIIAPYEKTGGEVKIIERETGRSLIDKLPLTVTEGDIWGFKALNTEESLSNGKLTIHPNPVTDIFTVQTPEKTELVEIYSSTGKLLKKVENQTQITIQELTPGMYVVKVKTDKGIYTHKILKK